MVICSEQGYYRRGTAYLAMGKFKEALKDFQQVFCLQWLASMRFLSSFFFFLVDKYGDNHFNISPDKYLKYFWIIL